MPCAPLVERVVLLGERISESGNLSRPLVVGHFEDLLDLMPRHADCEAEPDALDQGVVPSDVSHR